MEVGTPHPTEALELATVTESRDFVYDDLSRLVSSTQTPVNFGGSAAKYGVAKFGVDPYSASDEDGLIRTYHYDVLDRLTSVVFEDGKAASFEYWPEGQLKKMTDPDGKVTLYEYHPNGSLAKVKLERGGSVAGEFVYAYDAVGLPESITYPTETGIVAQFKSSSNARGWNENGQLLHLRYLKSGVPIREFEFDYDAAGNRIKQVDISSAGTFEWKYSYDYLDRLTKVEKKTGAGPLLEMSIYTYEYSSNSPVNYVDPLGLWELVPPSPSEVKKVYTGTRKVGSGVGLMGADGPFVGGDAVGLPLVGSGAKDIGEAMLEYLRRARSAPPYDDCQKRDDDDNDDLIFNWRGDKWRGDRAHFVPSVHKRVGIGVQQFQEDWLDDGYSRYAGRGNKPGRQIWHINNGGDRSIELVVEPEVGRTVRGIPVKGSFITARRFLSR